MLRSNSVNPPDFKSIFNQSQFKTESISTRGLKVILITGAQGMLGHGLAVGIDNLLVSQKVNDFKVILASRQWTSTSVSFWKKSPNIVLVTNQQISSLRDQIDLVIHTASPSNITQISTFEDLEWANLGLLREVLELTPQKIVYISSGEVYGGGDTVEKSVFNGFSREQKRDWYPISKLAAENALRTFQTEREIEVCVIRLFHTFGPGIKADDGRSFADVLWGATLNNQIVLKSQGNQVRTFLYLSDALEGIISLAFSCRPGFFTVNLGSTSPITILGFARTVANVVGASVKFEINETFDHSPNKTIIPNVDLMRLVGWSQKVSLEEGIQRTISWIRS
jgi:UDP-glucuronate decarboxylase